MNHVGTLEKHILDILQWRPTGATGTLIYDILDQNGYSCSVGSIYNTLQRMEDKGLVETKKVPSTKLEGKMVNQFEITGLGQKALAELDTFTAKLRTIATTATGWSC